MSELDPDAVEAAINGHEAEIMLLRQWVYALLDAHPNRHKVIERFRNEASNLSRSAPKKTDPEILVEIQARLQIQLAVVRQPFDPSP